MLALQVCTGVTMLGSKKKSFFFLVWWIIKYLRHIFPQNSHRWSNLFWVRDSILFGYNKRSSLFNTPITQTGVFNEDTVDVI